MMIRFTVPGIPVAKGRPRFSMKDGFPRTYTPANTLSYEAHVKVEGIAANCKPIDRPLKAIIEAWFPFPKSKDALKKIESNLGQCTKKPDVDNLAKAILDALNGVAYADDSQVYSLTVTKGYDKEPCVDVTLEYD